jgi:hypothetical protein
LLVQAATVSGVFRTNAVLLTIFLVLCPVSGVVVGCVGGGAIIVAIAAYYLYVVKPNSQLPPKTRDLENVPVVNPPAPIVAPAASLGYRPPPLNVLAHLVFDVDFEPHQ